MDLYGLLDAGGVLVVLLVWLAVRDVTARGRAAAGVCGGVLLLLAAGGAVGRVTVVGFSVAVPGGLLGGRDNSWIEVGLTLAGLAAGAVVATLHAHDVAVVDDDPVEPVDLPPLPASVWSRTEVIGDAPEHDGEVEPAPLPAPRPAQRGVAVPLLAVAAGIGLPLYSALSIRQSSRNVGGFHAYGMAQHMLVGAIAGLAVLGAAVALDVWERRLGIVAFVVAAVGVGVSNVWPRTFVNQYWIFAGIGLAAGLLAPATLAAVRRATGVDRRAVLAGVSVAFLLLGGMSYVEGRAYVERQERQVQF